MILLRHSFIPYFSCPPRMKWIAALAFLLAPALVNAQALYSKAFGHSSNRALIFLHGGPGSSAVYFEATTAQKLADKGFYVIIYDRRGEGRSVDKNAQLNYQEAFQDLNALYAKYGLRQATLIGYSFGGLVTTLYASKYPEKVRAIVLTSALVSQQQAYATILRSTRALYQQRQDSVALKDLSRIERLDINSLAYRTGCFQHATANGFFTLPHPNEVAQHIYATYATDSLLTRYVKNQEAVRTFWQNEPLKNIDVTDSLTNLRHRGINIYALYGQQDGLYSNEHITRLKQQLGANRVKYLNNCSHMLFVDQQTAFLASLVAWLK